MRAFPTAATSLRSPSKHQNSYLTRSACLNFASRDAGKPRIDEFTCRIRKQNFVGLGRMLDTEATLTVSPHKS